MSEEARIPGTDLTTEVPPNQGVRIKAELPKNIKEGEIVWLMAKRPNEIAAVDVPFKVTRLGSKLILEPVAAEDEKATEEKRRELARAIVQTHRNEIMEEAVKATGEALTRKPVEKLERMKAKSDEGARAKVGTRRGCMFLDIGGEETIL